jgi:hypothetical protein
MQPGSNVRRFAGVAALMVVAGGGISACVITSPTATLKDRTVTVVGTEGDDHLVLASDATQLTVDLDGDSVVDAQFPRTDFDHLQVVAGGGNDGISLTGAGDFPTTIDGGAGDDGIGVVGHIGDDGTRDAPISISGDDGNDNIFAATPGPITLEGGAGDDRVEGGGAGVGQERVSLGDGNDRFVSSLNTFVGARTDIVDGGAGHDSMEMDGTFADESVGLSASAGHLVVDDNRSHIDAVGIEDVKYVGFGGNDAGDGVAVDDLSTTDVTDVTTDFSAPNATGTPNNSSDTLTVRGTDKVDHITISGSGANVTVAGLVPTVHAIGLDHADVLNIDTLGGTDVIDRAGLTPGLVQLFIS